MADELDIFAAELQNSNDASKSINRPQISSEIASARTDSELQQFLSQNDTSTVVIKFGSTWCHSCQKIFPHFYQLTKKYSNYKFIVAQIDYMQEAAKGVHYTPTFRIMSNGQMIDQFYGASHISLEDHLWLHSDD